MLSLPKVNSYYWNQLLTADIVFWVRQPKSPFRCCCVHRQQGKLEFRNVRSGNEDKMDRRIADEREN